MTAIIKIDSLDVTDYVESWEINRSDGWVIDATINFADLTHWAACAPDVDPTDLRISIKIGSDTILFLIDERQESIDASSAKFNIWCRSKHALLGEKYAQTISDLSQENPWEGVACSFSQAIIGALAYCPETITVALEITNYNIEVGALSVENQYPIDVIKTLADSVGAEIIPELDGSLTIKEYVPAVVSEMPTKTETYSELDDIVLLSCQTEDTAGHDAVLIYGYGSEDIEPANWLGAEMVEDGPYYVSTGRYKYHVRLYFYMNDFTEPVVYTPSENIDITVENSSFYYGFLAEPRGKVDSEYAGVFGYFGEEEIAEEVKLKWGRGNTSIPDTEGVTLVTGDESEYFELSSQTYNTYLIDYEVYCEDKETVEIFFYLADRSAESSISISFEFEPATDDNAATGQSFLKAVIVSDPPYTSPVDVRLYLWHNTYGHLSVEYASLNDVATIARGSSDTESITENVRLTWGVGQTSMPDTDGNTDVIDLTYEAEPIAEISVTYSVYYSSYTVSGDPGDYELIWYYPDKSASSALSLTIVEAEPAPEVIDHPIRVINHYDKTPIDGAAVSLDGVSKGLTTSDGFITLASVTRGVTYDVLITKTGYADSDDDLIFNDSITIPEA